MDRSEEAANVRQNLMVTGAMPILSGALTIRILLEIDMYEPGGLPELVWFLLVTGSTAMGFVLIMLRYRKERTQLFLLYGVLASLIVFACLTILAKLVGGYLGY